MKYQISIDKNLSDAEGEMSIHELEKYERSHRLSLLRIDIEFNKDTTTYIFESAQLLPRVVRR